MLNSIKSISTDGMTRSQTSGVVLIAAMGMMASLMAVEIMEIVSWSELATPKFVGTLLMHFGTVIGAYVAGRLIPENRDGKSTRREDESSEEV